MAAKRYSPSKDDGITAPSYWTALANKRCRNLRVKLTALQTKVAVVTNVLVEIDGISDPYDGGDPAISRLVETALLELGYYDAKNKKVR